MKGDFQQRGQLNFSNHLSINDSERNGDAEVFGNICVYVILVIQFCYRSEKDVETNFKENVS